MKRTCRHCQTEFVPTPGKKGFIDECPECVADRYEAKPALVPALVPAAPVVKKQRPFSQKAFNRNLRDLARLIAQMERM